MGEPDGYISVKNWQRFQHYKDRNPLWIKLYNELLDRYHFMGLNSVQKWHLIGIWLMASKHNNQIPLDLGWIRREIGATEDIDLKPLMRWVNMHPVEAPPTPHDPTEFRGKRNVTPANRELVMIRDGHKCVTCGATENLEIDHVVPVRHGGTSEIENLQVLCRSCNRRKRTRWGPRSKLLQREDKQRSLEKSREE